MHPLDIAVNCGYNVNGTGDDVSKLQLVVGGGSSATVPQLPDGPIGMEVNNAEQNHLEGCRAGKI